MPDLTSHPASNITKLLLMGDPGAGKTGALASLAHAGYNLRIFDLDNGLDILKNLLLSPRTPYDKEAYKRVKYQTITERHVKITAKSGPNEVPASASVWNRITQQLMNWRTESEELGPITSWTERDVFVLDSMTMAGIAAHNFANVSTAGDRNRDPRMIYFHAQNYLEYLMQCLYADDVKCNVIVTSHITFIGGDDNITHGYPTTIGRALSGKIGRYFNSALLMKSEGRAHKLFTVPIATKVELKSSAPLNVKDTYDIKFGLADYFKDVRGSAPAPVLQIAAAE